MTDTTKLTEGKAYFSSSIIMIDIEHNNECMFLFPKGLEIETTEGQVLRASNFYMNPYVMRQMRDLINKRFGGGRSDDVSE